MGISQFYTAMSGRTLAFLHSILGKGYQLICNFFDMDSTYLLFSLPALILTIAAQIYVKTTFNKYSKIPSGEDKTGLDAAQDIIKGESFSVTVVLNQNPLEISLIQ